MTAEKLTGAPVQVMLRMKSATYGGDHHKNATVSVRVDVWREYEKDFDLEAAESSIGEKLLGKVATQQLRIKSYDEPVLEKGDTVSRFHLRYILDNIDWSKPGQQEWLDSCEWGNEIRKVIQDAYNGYLSKVSSRGDTKISVNFDFPEGKERFASLSMSHSVAQWLGSVLLSATEDASSELVAEVQNGNINGA